MSAVGSCCSDDLMCSVDTAAINAASRRITGHQLSVRIETLRYQSGANACLNLYLHTCALFAQRVLGALSCGIGEKVRAEIRVIYQVRQLGTEEREPPVGPGVAFLADPSGIPAEVLARTRKGCDLRNFAQYPVSLPPGFP